jgi:hypothetical protein
LNLKLDLRQVCIAFLPKVGCDSLICFQGSTNCRFLRLVSGFVVDSLDIGYAYHLLICALHGGQIIDVRELLVQGVLSVVIFMLHGAVGSNLDVCSFMDSIVCSNYLMYWR